MSTVEVLGSVGISVIEIAVSDGLKESNACETVVVVSVLVDLLLSSSSAEVLVVTGTSRNGISRGSELAEIVRSFLASVKSGIIINGIALSQGNISLASSELREGDVINREGSWEGSLVEERDWAVGEEGNEGNDEEKFVHFK